MQIYIYFYIVISIISKLISYILKLFLLFPNKAISNNYILSLIFFIKNKF